MVINQQKAMEHWGPYIAGTSFKPVAGPRLPGCLAVDRRPGRHIFNADAFQETFSGEKLGVFKWRSLVVHGGIIKWDIVEDRSTSVVDASFCGNQKIDIPIGSMVLLYMVTWIPSIYPKC